MLTMQLNFNHLSTNWQLHICPFVVFYLLHLSNVVLFSSKCTYSHTTLTNWFQSQFDCCSVFYFLNRRTERRFEGFNFSEERSHTCEVMPSVKIFQVWARQLQNILIMAIIDREDRLCELMNPKGALWCERDCDIQICAWLSLNQIAPQK